MSAGILCGGWECMERETRLIGDIAKPSVPETWGHRRVYPSTKRLSISTVSDPYGLHLFWGRLGGAFH